MIVDRISKVTLYVNDQEESKRFWTEKLGFAVTFEQQMGPGMTWLEVAPKSDSGTTLVLYSKAAMQEQKPEMISHPGLFFSTDDIDAAWQELKDKGVEVEEIQRMPYGTMFTFKDPDGNGYLIRD